MLEVKIVSQKEAFEDKAVNEIAGVEEDEIDDTEHYLVVKHKGKVVRVVRDGMEPEDVTFFRDLGWIPAAIKEAYKLGLEDGKSEVQ